jgi:hypothetical protein
MLACLMLAPGGTGAALQSTSSVPLGPSTLTYTSDWELLGGDDESATLQHSDPPFTLFDYSVYPDNAMGTSDSSELITVSRIDALARQDDIISGINLATRGTLADGTVWELYTMEVNGIPIFYLVAANVDLVPGMDVVSSIATPQEDLVAAHFAVMAGITVDGGPTLVARIPSEDVLGAAIDALELIEDARLPVPPAGPAS